jgi:hypothetical protein
MRAFVHAFAHPYFAVTDAHGRFVIAGVPPGIHTLTLWHEGWRVTGPGIAGVPQREPPVVLRQTVEVAPGRDAAVDLTLR